MNFYISKEILKVYVNKVLIIFLLFLKVIFELKLVFGIFKTYQLLFIKNM
jgi:hypothetical protein